MIRNEIAKMISVYPLKDAFYDVPPSLMRCTISGGYTVSSSTTTISVSGSTSEVNVGTNFVIGPMSGHLVEHIKAWLLLVIMSQSPRNKKTINKSYYLPMDMHKRVFQFRDSIQHIECGILFPKRMR